MESVNIHTQSYMDMQSQALCVFTGYNLYIKDKRADVRLKLLQDSAPDGRVELGAEIPLIAKQWKALTSEQQAVFNNHAKEIVTVVAEYNEK